MPTRGWVVFWGNKSCLRVAGKQQKKVVKASEVSGTFVCLSKIIVR